MRRKEHRRPARARLADQLVEDLLVQRIESPGGLVEDEQRRPMHEREDEQQLLLVAMRVLAVTPAEIEVEPLGEARHDRVRNSTPQAGDVRHDHGAAPAAELRRLAGDVADLALHRDGVALAVEPEDRRASARRMDHSHEEPDRRRLSRAVRSKETEHLAFVDGEIEVEDPAMSAVVFRERVRRDGGPLPCVHRSHSPPTPINVASKTQGLRVDRGSLCAA